MPDDGDRTDSPGKTDARRLRRDYWRSLVEHHEGARDSSGKFLGGEFPGGEFPAGEFPPGADLLDGLGRRDFMKLLGASMALAGCAREPTTKILPYAARPVEIAPGIANHYATTMSIDGFGVGLIIESHEGRPTKVEGNPEHPASLGKSGVYEQASILQLYDPQRARSLRHHDRDTSWDSFVEAMSRGRGDRGAGLRIVLPPSSAPHLGELFQRLVARYPKVRFTFYSPCSIEGTLDGARLAFGRPLQPTWDLTRATTLLSLDADFLGATPGQIRHAHDFASRRRIDRPADSMSRLYVVEGMLSLTGTMADHRLRRRPSEVVRVAAAIAAELFREQRPTGMPDGLLVALDRLRDPDVRFAGAVARDLRQRGADSLVLVGERQPPEVHALGHAINSALNSAGSKLIEPTLIEFAPTPLPAIDLATLAAEIDAGTVDTLLILEGNPAYDAPADLEFGRRIAAVPSSIYLGLYANETARASTWFVPAAHYLEAWGDGRATCGTASLAQPLIAPLGQGYTAAEVVAPLAGAGNADAFSLLHDFWTQRHGLDRIAWERALQLGVIVGTTSPPVAAPIAWGAVASALGSVRLAATDGIEVDFLPDPNLYDGRFANNAWLLELGDPITKITWDNAAHLSPRTARRLGLDNGDLVALTVAGRRIKTPVFVVPGCADELFALRFGWGREGGELTARNVGVNVFPLRTTKALHFASGATVVKLGGQHALASTQIHWTMHGRAIALATTLAELRADPDFAHEEARAQPSLMTPVAMVGDQWAMSIDLSICTGCSACMVACQAENNVLVVGKSNVLKSREMHWLRVDLYFTGDAEEPGVVHQPMLCQHCEKAPCEYVCPVNATVHSPDGLNEMVYNRCVGTRFCSNNCPYKVRRFNWFNWVKQEPANQGLVKLQRNPDVTVRERGVMEKCSYCVQRIREAEIGAEKERRPLRAGEVVTACQQACPTSAIQFDSLRHTDSAMAKWRRQERAYKVLNELGTEPRTRYLARVDNPNPELVK